MTRIDTLRTVLVYYAVALTILVIGYFFPTRTEFATYTPILLSILLLIPIYLWQKIHCRNIHLSREAAGHDKGMVLFSIFALFALALSIRIPSALLFGMPYEKTPLIYLLVLTVVLVEKTSLSTFGFKTKNLLKSHLYGFAFFALLAGLSLTVSYIMIYGFTGQMPVQSFDIASCLLSMPFMTLCVGVSEEGFFRGYAQTHLEKLFTSKQAILAQAILFGGWHFVWNLSPFDPFAMAQYVTTTFFAGLMFGYFYSKTRNLVPLIFAHGLWDSVPPWIVSNKSALDHFSTFPSSYQISVSILPFALAALATVLFIGYLVEEI